MSREPRHESRPSAERRCDRSRNVAELIERGLAAARAHAERGRMTDANARVLELRSGLVGHRPGDEEGLLRRRWAPASSRNAPSQSDDLDPPFRRDDPGPGAGDEARPGLNGVGGRNDWLEAIQLSAQAIADLARVSVAAKAPAVPEVRSATLAVWESRHRDRFTRWARCALAERDPVERTRAEGPT